MRNLKMEKHHKESVEKALDGMDAPSEPEVDEHEDRDEDSLLKAFQDLLDAAEELYRNGDSKK